MTQLHSSNPAHSHTRARPALNLPESRVSRWLRLALVSVVVAVPTAVAITTAVPAFAQDEVVITEKARKHFRAGVNFTNDPDGARYADAYREFKLAYAESPSWKILGNLGIAAMKLERDGDAIEAFKVYLREGGDEIEAGEREQVTRDLETMESSVTWVTVTVTPAGARLVDRRMPLSGSPVLNVYELDGPTRIGLHAGDHRFSVELEGYEPGTWTFEAQGGEMEKTFDLVKIVEKKDPVAPVVQDESEPVVERPVPWGVWAGVGLTGAFVVGGAVTGILATGKRSDYNEMNDGTDIDGARDLRKSGQTLNLMTDIFLGGAVVAAGVTAVLYATRPEVTRDERALILAPSAYPGGGGLWMQGSF